MAKSSRRETAQQIADRVLSKKKRDKGGGSKKYGRNRKKCANYRSRVGKPLGRGIPGNKKGRNRR